MKSILIAGSHYEMGRQHAWQVYRWRKMIRQRIEARLAEAPEPGFARALQDELLPVLHDYCPGLLEMLGGLAEGLGFAQEWLFRYLAIAYLRDRWRFAAGDPLPDSFPGDGCTVWAARSAAQGGEPLLVKNRDYRLDHLRLQMVAQVEPASGYRYLCVTSAGVPGVFSSGLNAAGLAVADTRVLTPDLGPGLPAYALMMEILEKHDSLESALDYLAAAPLMGGHTLALVDAAGGMAVVEVGHRRQEPIWGEGDFLVTTNHFVSRELGDQWVDEGPPAWQGDSLRRKATAEARLARSAARITLAWARQLTADPEIARRAEPDWPFGTLSSAIYLPRRRRLSFRQGPPWMGRYRAYSLGAGQSAVIGKPVVSKPVVSNQ